MHQHPTSLARRRLFVASVRFASLGALLVGCAGAPPPPPVVVAHHEPAPPPPPPLPPSRWVDAGGATAIGPAVPDGTLVLLGGRRAVVGKDGSLHPEKSPSPEALQEIIAVPTASGPRLVARGSDTLYRLDDPLGAPAPILRLDTSIHRFGAGPGVVAVWTARSDLPTFLDIETGKPRPIAGLPEPPLRAITFLDPRRGAAVFEAAGLAITVDGGASWKPAADGGAAEAMRMNGVRRRGDALRAYAYSDGPDAAIDLDSARVGALEQPSAPANEPPLLRWIRLTGRDPLDAAVAGGIEMTTGGALVASHGLLGRVDTRTGTLLDLTEFARGKWMNPCTLGRAGSSALVACTLSEEIAGADLFDPFGVFSVSLTAPDLKADRPSLVRNGDVEFIASPAGGAMLLGPCTSDEDAQACVRQADGKWLPMHAEVELNGRGAAPTADGKIAVLRGLTDGDEVAEPDPGGAAAAPPAQIAGEGDEDAPRPRRVHVSLLDPSGKEQALPPFEVSTRYGEVQITGTLEEEADHALHFVVDGGDGPQSVIQPLSRDPASVQKIPGVTTARIRAGHGIAVGQGHLLASLDGGGSWNEVQAPPFAMEFLSSFGGGPVDGSQLEVSEIGVKLGPVLRVGWGPSEAMSEPRPHPDAPRLELPKQPPPGPDKLLRCKSEGTSPSIPPLLGTTQVQQALQSKLPAKGTRREISTYGMGRAGVLDIMALLEEEGPDKKGSSPARWTLKWQDPSELGGKQRSVSMPAAVPASAAAPPSAAPKGKALGKPQPTSVVLPWGANLRFAAAFGGRALFYLRASGKNLLVRTANKGSGVETAEVSSDLAPAGEVVFGADKADTIAWMHDNTLIVWLPGEAPRAVTSIPTRSVRTLGEPTKEGIPVMLSATDWSIQRMVAVPSLDKNDKNDKKTASKLPPMAPSLDGWARVPNIRREIGALAACAPKPKGARFSIRRSAITAVVDGAGEAGSLALYDVRVSDGAACVAGLSGLLTPDRRVQPAPPAPPSPAPGGKKKLLPAAAAATGPVAFVRVDLVGKHAEGGDRGILPGASVRKLGCTLGDKL